MDMPTLGLMEVNENQKDMRGLVIHTIINSLQPFKIIYIMNP